METVEDQENTEKNRKPSVKKIDSEENKLMMLFYDIEDSKHLKILKEKETLEAFYKPID